MPSTRRYLQVADVEPFVRQRCFTPSDRGLVGIELEQLTGFAGSGAALVDHVEVRTALTSLGPLPGGSSVTFEPGGQVEVSSPPRPGASAACAVTSTDLATVTAALDEMGVGLVAMGLDPRGCGRRLLDEPRYRAMETYFAGYGPEGHTMMCATASLQVNLDAGEERDHVRRWRLVHDLGPMLLAAFANSPFTDGEPNGWRSGRAAVWAGIDATRTRPAAGGGDDDPATAWARYALDAHVMMMRTSGGSFVALSSPLPFTRWVEEGHELGYPTLDDLAYHLGTLFPPVRPRGWLELRMIDAVPDPWWRAAVAVVNALVDDPEAGAVAARATAATAGCWADAARHGLDHPALAAAARTCVPAALGALARLGADATTVAAVENFHERFVAQGRCPADDLLDDHRRLDGVWPRPAAREAAWT